MIIEGKPELGLQKHQQKAYKAVTDAFIHKNRASVVIPTGCGKSFISLQLMMDNKNKNMLFMAPSNAIRNQMYEYIAKYVASEEPTKTRSARTIAEECFPNLRIILYPSLLRMKDDVMNKLKPDIIFMDELHRTAADKWAPKIDELISKNPNAKILGLTATPERMDNVNVIDELFSGNIDYELTLVDAMRQGILQQPTYVKCDYALKDSLETIKDAIDNCKDSQTKKQLQEKYDKMRRIVEHADGIRELFTKNITKKDGKYIVFCKDKNHMDEMMEKAKEWFSDIDEEPEMYSVYSGEGYTKKGNEQTLQRFNSSKSSHIKLLFSVEMLNEGLHVEDISGAIMLRPTESRIIYLQQLGRVLSSDPSREKPIIFDLVNNYLKNNLDAELNQKGKTQKGQGRTDREYLEDYDYDDSQDIDIFRIQGDTKEFLELFEEAKELFGITSYLETARNIKAWIAKNGNSRPPNQHSKDPVEKRLGSALRNMKRDLIKPYLALETEEERLSFREKRPNFDEIKAIIDEIDRNNVPISLANARAIKQWIANSKKTTPPSPTSKNEEERRLGTALSTIRQNWIKPYMELKTQEEREEFEEDHPEIVEIVSIVDEIDRNNIPILLANARAIKQWIANSGDVTPPRLTAKGKEEKTLANALSTIRRNLVNPYLELETEPEREAFRKKHPETEEVVAIIQEIDHAVVPTLLLHARNIKAWMGKNQDTTIPPNQKSKDKVEKSLGQALSQIRVRLVKPYMELQTEEERKIFKKEHPETDEVIAIISEIDRNIVPPYLAAARAIHTWVKNSENPKYPVRTSEDKNEKKLGSSLSNIRTLLIKPYMSLETEAEKEKFRASHPEIDEIMDIISRLDMQCGTAKQKALAALIRKDIEKRKILDEAKALEGRYEELVSEKAKVQPSTETEVSIDES